MASFVNFLLSPCNSVPVWHWLISISIAVVIGGIIDIILEENMFIGKIKKAAEDGEAIRLRQDYYKIKKY